jgi:hypothetical protein
VEVSGPEIVCEESTGVPALFFQLVNAYLFPGVSPSIRLVMLKVTEKSLSNHSEQLKGAVPECESPLTVIVTDLSISRPDTPKVV